MGYTVDAIEENGLDSYYYVYSATGGSPYQLYHDQAVHTHYYDYETGQIDYEPYYSAVLGYALGAGMTSSYDYVDFGSGDHDTFGYDTLYGYNYYQGIIYRADA